MIAYLITNLTNGRKYVGITTKTLAHRWNSHKALARAGIRTALCAAIRKYGSDNFLVEQIASGLSTEGLKDSERHLIRQHGSRSPKGYNMTDGGDGTNGLRHMPSARSKIAASSRGRYHTPSSKEKLRLAHKGKTLSISHRAKLSSAHTGLKIRRSKEHNAKIAAAHLGYKFSDAAKAKMSAAKKGKPWSEKRRTASR